MNPSSLETIYLVHEENKRLSEENEALRLKVKKLKLEIAGYVDKDVNFMRDADNHPVCECTEETETEYEEAFTVEEMAVCAKCNGKVYV